MNKGTSLTILRFMAATLISVCGHAQNKEEEEDHHHHHKNEISVATGIVPLVAEDKLTAGFHLHYIKGVGKNSRLGLGVGFETIIDEHKHYTLSAVLQYRIYKGLILATAPGLLMRKENSANVLQFAQHIEIAYEFELGDFHIGPVAELGIELTGIHYMGGIHFGIDF